MWLGRAGATRLNPRNAQGANCNVRSEECVQARGAPRSEDSRTVANRSGYA